MTTSIRQQESGIGDVDHNMMGIESRSLYEFLHKVVEDQDLKMFESSDARLVMKDLIPHMTIAIPERIFSTPQEALVELQKRLSGLADHLASKFSDNGQYPFTMRRICELCYDPLKYYKVNELSKYVNAMSSCCMVSSPWGSYTNKEEKDAGRGENNRLTGLDQEDVSLTRIPWIEEKADTSLSPLIAQIDSLMSINFAFDEDEEIVDDDLEFGPGSHRDEHFDMEAYGGSILDCEEEEDEEDEDYVESLKFDEEEEQEEDAEEDAEEEEEEEEDEEEDEYEEEKGEGKEEQTRKQEDGKQTIEEGAEVRHQKTYPTNGRSPLKRNATELDNYKYEEEGSLHDYTPPKKFRQSANGNSNSNDDHQGIHESPQLSRIPDNDETPNFSQEVVSPVDDVDGAGTQRSEDKRRSLIDSNYDNDVSSPLSNRTRLS